MKTKDVFAQFFTNLLKLENQGQARDIAKAVWPGTRDLWLHTMDIDPVLIELDLASIGPDGRVLYRTPETESGWSGWEFETPVGDPKNPILVLEDGTKCAWSVVKHLAKKNQIQFRLDLAQVDILFYLGPDIFPDSYRMVWLTPEEQNGGDFLDNRVRSSDPDDFLSRIEHLTSGSGEPFVPKS